MKVKFLGAARTVTGSCHVVETDSIRFSVDCGMHQGNEEIERRNLDTPVYQPQHLDFILITHAHIDHSGLLPRMVKKGFKGPIYLTPPTKDLLEIMLADSAHIQEQEAEYSNLTRKRRGVKKVEPLYDMNDAMAVPPLFRAVEYGQEFSPAPGVKVRYNDAGHILGSAFIEIWIEENGDATKLVFSGDLGRANALLMKDPQYVAHADYLFMESTYGNREHKNPTESLAELAEAIAYSYERGQKVIIPAFAVERTQEILYCLHLINKQGKLPADMPVYLDSPLAIKATEIFKRHPEYFDAETQALFDKGEDPLTLPNLHYTESREKSREINETEGAAVVISASGMCNAGRVKHHLRHNLYKDGASIVFVGYQAAGTPGRRIVDGAKRIRIYGEDVVVAAKIFTIGGFSSHAGQTQMLEWLGRFKRDAGMEVFLIHGEAEAQDVFAGLIRKRYGLTVRIPDYLEEYALKPGVEPKVTLDVERARPAIDWGFILRDTGGKFEELNRRLGQIEKKPWVDQTDIRQRVLELNKDLMEILSEI